MIERRERRMTSVGAAWRSNSAPEDAHPRTRTDMNSISLKIGTRGSPLALAQAGEVRALLARAHGCDLERFEIVVIRTSGDMVRDRALAEAGGKGLFTKEIDAAMLMGEIDVAVHSAKDLPTVLPEGIVVAGYLPREDVRDALISTRADTIAGLPRGGTLGTASLRRQAQVKRLRPDLEVGLLRGNVETRLGKAERGEIDATLLAYAGLKRLGLARRATALLDIETFLPAVGQGAIALTARAGDAGASGALAPILDAATGCALAAERAFLGALDGSCRTPIAGHARIDGGMLDFRGMVLRADGSETFEVHARGDMNEAARLGRSAGLDLSNRLPAGVLP
jgi:hydroxymethylbilane synthase